MTSTGYAFGDGKFYEVELGIVDGRATIVSDPVEVPPEQAVPSLIQDYTNGRLGGTTDNIENGTTFSREKPVDMHGEVIAPTARSVLSQPGSASEQFQTLHRLFGDDPKVISLVANGGDGTGRQLAEQTWGADKVSEVLQNFTPADEPVTESPKVIENSRALYPYFGELKFKSIARSWYFALAK